MKYNRYNKLLYTKKFNSNDFVLYTNNIKMFEWRSLSAIAMFACIFRNNWFSYNFKNIEYLSLKA